jgi:6-phosphogluconate dehydrogenase
MGFCFVLRNSFYFYRMKHQAIIITGVAGSGKSSVGALLAQQLGSSFYDGDEFHPEANIEKMRRGVALNDADRAPWLQSIHDFIVARLQLESLVLACSALKQQYRDVLEQGIPPSQLQWVHLQGDFDIVYPRIQQRAGHFMPLELLQSQYDTYEAPRSGLKIDVNQPLVSIVEKIEHLLKPESETGVLGLGVMGTNLARNIAGKGISLSVFNRYMEGLEENIALKATQKYPELLLARPYDDLRAFVASLRRPRKILLMINAGPAIDEVLQQLTPLLSEGDVVIDGGNSHFKDSERRMEYLAAKHIHYLGSGISGGEEGALKGPSIMPGGSMEAYASAAPVFEKIAAVNPVGERCCRYIGGGGAGHFVKMVHNGIEYAEMQLIAEVYGHFRWDQGLSPEAIAEIFTQWNEGAAQSYLLEITIDILLKRDDDGLPLLDKVSDAAANKGTGSWTTVSACELGVPIPSITAALFARYQSALTTLRTELAVHFKTELAGAQPELDDVYNLYLFCRILNHQQGFRLIQEASASYHWNIELESLASIWSGGCIIRSRLLSDIRPYLTDHSDILLIPWVADFINAHYSSVVRAYQSIAGSHSAIPCISAGVEYFKYMSQEESNASLLQAQRDYFGAHTYERKDLPGKSFHTNWKG